MRSACASTTAPVEHTAPSAKRTNVCNGNDGLAERTKRNEKRGGARTRGSRATSTAASTAEAKPHTAFAWRVSTSSACDDGARRRTEAWQAPERLLVADVASVELDAHAVDGKRLAHDVKHRPAVQVRPRGVKGALRAAGEERQRNSRAQQQLQRARHGGERRHRSGKHRVVGTEAQRVAHQARAGILRRGLLGNKRARPEPLHAPPLRARASRDAGGARPSGRGANGPLKDFAKAWQGEKSSVRQDTVVSLHSH